MLGAFSVGKTSLVKRFVESIFSEEYHTTVGVKVDKKVLNLDGQDITLLVWDIHGEDDVRETNTNYLRGSGGYFLVVDGTRDDTLAVASELQHRVEALLGPLPFVLLVNKSDLNDEWKIDDQALSDLTAKGWKVLKTSAKTGDGVENAFLALSRLMVTEPCN